jgi:SHOCT-like domain
MATVAERLKILKMLEAGQITAAEAERLLAVLDDDRPGGEKGTGEAGRPGDDPRWFRVRVTNLATGTPKVNVNLPIGLLDVGLRMGARFAPEMQASDLGRVLSAIRAGASGKIVDVQDEERGDHVEVFVE